MLRRTFTAKSTQDVGVTVKAGRMQAHCPETAVRASRRLAPLKLETVGDVTATQEASARNAFDFANELSIGRPNAYSKSTCQTWTCMSGIKTLNEAEGLPSDVRHEAKSTSGAFMVAASADR